MVARRVVRGGENGLRSSFGSAAHLKERPGDLAKRGVFQRLQEVGKDVAAGRLGLDQLAKDVSMQGDETRRNDPHHHVKKVDRQPIRCAFSCRERRTGDERLAHQRGDVQPHHGAISVAG
jgi:hypothetical protein